MKTGLSSNQFIPTSSQLYFIRDHCGNNRITIRTQSKETQQISKHALASLGDERACTGPAWRSSRRDQSISHCLVPTHLIILCGLRVSSHVVRASLPAVRLGYVIDMQNAEQGRQRLIEGLGHSVLDFLSKKVITVSIRDIYADLKCPGPTRQSQCCCSPILAAKRKPN